jgi:hypothetical protein
MIRRHLAVIVTLLSLACGNDPMSSSSSVQLPTAPAADRCADRPSAHVARQQHPRQALRSDG